MTWKSERVKALLNTSTKLAALEGFFPTEGHREVYILTRQLKLIVRVTNTMAHSDTKPSTPLFLPSFIPGYFYAMSTNINSPGSAGACHPWVPNHHADLATTCTHTNTHPCNKLLRTHEVLLTGKLQHKTSSLNRCIKKCILCYRCHRTSMGTLGVPSIH